MKIRELIQKGDPVVRVKLPEPVLTMLKADAKNNRRRIQDEFIKILATSFKEDGLLKDKYPHLYAEMQNTYEKSV